MIVKVQVPIFSTEDQDLALIYNENRTFQHQIPVDKHIKSKMRGEFKQFFHLEKFENGKITLGKQAVWQGW